MQSLMPTLQYMAKAIVAKYCSRVVRRAEEPNATGIQKVCTPLKAHWAQRDLVPLFFSVNQLKSQSLTSSSAFTGDPRGLFTVVP